MDLNTFVFAAAIMFLVYIIIRLLFRK